MEDSEHFPVVCTTNTDPLHAQRFPVCSFVSYSAILLAAYALIYASISSVQSLRGGNVTVCDRAMSGLLTFRYISNGCYRISMMSYAEKPEDITKEEWMEKLNNVHIQRADMNRLIMNYLVTGEACNVRW